jgi:squalene-hopene/tetraprenyl-beta-curcumene cyclase
MAVSQQRTLGRSEELANAIQAAISWLEHSQDPEGFWVGMLESNCCIEAEWLLAFHILGVRHPAAERIIRGILDRQRSDGSWDIYFESPSGDINATVECYAALRACGRPPDSPELRRAREWILSHGGVLKTRVFTRYWLALIGEWPWERTPNLPPEVIRFPKWFPFNIYNFASWARATLMPLAVLSARRHVVPLPLDGRLDELFPGGRERMDLRLPRKGGLLSWSAFFLGADRILHGLQSAGLTPGRPAAVARCLEWILRHQDADGAWGGIQPPWIYSLMALHAEGFPLSHPVIAKGLGALDAHWSYQRGEGLRIQASESPVWDTALSLLAMLDCGVSPRDSAAFRRAVDWLLDMEVRGPGDWSQKMPGVAPGGWAFERANTMFPDVDDTAVVLIVLARCREFLPNRDRVDAAIARATEWLLAMQCRNGGWAAFDRDNDKQILTRIPFCDFGETLDPPSVDVSAHVIEAFACLGMDVRHPAVDRGLRFIRSEQEQGGSWFGRWGVNHVYGTAAVLPALAAIGEDMSQGYIRRAAEWLLAHQNSDGGWGESCASYMDSQWIGRGPSTASQTAWALMALGSVGIADFGESVARGLHYLTSCQINGTWDEPYYTGTGFPGYGAGARTELADPELSRKLNQGTELQRGFMINYNLYRHYFPLMALGRLRQILA